MTDIKTQTKIAVLIEKINYLFSSIQQNGGMVNNIDKDLMMNYVRELYELTMSLQPDVPQQQMPVQQQMNPYNQQQIYQQHLPQNPNQGQMPRQQQQPQPPQQFQNPPYQSGMPQVNGNGNYNPPQQQPEPPPVTGPGQSIQQSYSGLGQQKTLADLYSIKTGKDKPSVNEKLNPSKTELADKLKKAPIKDMKVFIGLNKRFSYINFLFNNNTRLYDEAIDKINGSKNYDEAMSYIESELVPKLKWQPEDEIVAEFYNIIERRFLV